MITIKNMRVAFTKEYDALHDINLEIEKGEKLALVGDNESGKTTLIRVLAGLQSITSGNVIIDNNELSKTSFKQDVSVGYVPKTVVFKEKKTVLENMRYVLKIRGFDEASMNYKILSALKNYGVESVKNVPVQSLTYVQKQLVQLARVSMRKLDIVLINNITKELVNNEKAMLEKAIKLLIEQQPDAIFIIAFDDEKIAKELGLRIIKLKNGSIQNK